jgi:hypothetical protein
MKSQYDFHLFILITASLIIFYSSSDGQINKYNSIYFNEYKLKGLLFKTNLDSLDQVFGLVFSSLDDTVYVFPTENYYYFVFHANGKEIWGNIRLPREERDRGYLCFAYWEFDNFPQQMEDPNYFSESDMMGPEKGVMITRLSELVYEVEYTGKRVVFMLNNLKQNMPESVLLRKDEKFLMHTCDESGLRFYLLFNEKTNDFLYVLDEEKDLSEDFFNLNENFLFGKRTQFVFYDDVKYSRKVLVAVNAENIKRNNYYDGPFDQLADNFITISTGLKKCLNQAYPYAKGRLNDYGEFVDDDGKPTDVRMAITPYYDYYTMEDLMYFVERSWDNDEDKYYSNLVYDYKKDVPR